MVEILIYTARKLTEIGGLGISGDSSLQKRKATRELISNGEGLFIIYSPNSGSSEPYNMMLYFRILKRMF